MKSSDRSAAHEGNDSSSDEEAEENRNSSRIGACSEECSASNAKSTKHAVRNQYTEDDGDTSEIPLDKPPQSDITQMSNASSPLTRDGSASTSVTLESKLTPSSHFTDLTEDLAWTNLPNDLQYYLDYHQKSVTYHHYFFKHDANHFLHNILIEQALCYDPLLYAVVGFSAFQVRRCLSIPRVSLPQLLPLSLENPEAYSFRRYLYLKDSAVFLPP